MRPRVDELRALTLRCWWAFAVTHLNKRLENRKWKPWPAIAGKRVAIHAGRWPKTNTEKKQAEEAVAWMRDRELMKYSHLQESASDVYARGGKIVALATIGEPVTESDDPWFIGPFGWPLLDVVVLPEPVPYRGAIGLWRVPPEIAARVLEQDRRAA